MCLGVGGRHRERSHAHKKCSAEGKGRQIHKWKPIFFVRERRERVWLLKLESWKLCHAIAHINLNTRQIRASFHGFSSTSTPSSSACLSFLGEKQKIGSVFGSWRWIKVWIFRHLDSKSHLGFGSFLFQAIGVFFVRFFFFFPINFCVFNLNLVVFSWESAILVIIELGFGVCNLYC